MNDEFPNIHDHYLCSEAGVSLEFKEKLFFFTWTKFVLWTLEWIVLEISVCNVEAKETKNVALIFCIVQPFP